MTRYELATMDIYKRIEFFINKGFEEAKIGFWTFFYYNQGFVKKEKQYAGDSPTFLGLIQTAGQL